MDIFAFHDTHDECNGSYSNVDNNIEVHKLHS